MEHVQHRAIDKVAKVLERGLDPNFHDLETGGGCGGAGAGGRRGRNPCSWGLGE